MASPSPRSSVYDPMDETSTELSCSDAESLYSTQAVEPSNGDELSDSWSISQLYSLSWFHGGISRHVAEKLLLNNGVDGSYLLREGDSDTKKLTLSVRCLNAVKHYKIDRMGNHFVFGQREFEGPDALAKHFESLPMVGGESGVLTLFSHPYPRHVDESGVIEEVLVHHMMVDMPSKACSRPPVLAVGSKEGFLIKRGWFRQNWKRRWFVLEGMRLAYYRSREATKVSKPLRELDLNDCVSVNHDTSQGVEYCMAIAFESRIFYCQASSPSELQEWVETLRWKLRHRDDMIDIPRTSSLVQRSWPLERRLSQSSDDTVVGSRGEADIQLDRLDETE